MLRAAAVVAPSPSPTPAQLDPDVGDDWRSFAGSLPLTAGARASSANLVAPPSPSTTGAAKEFAARFPERERAEVERRYAEAMAVQRRFEKLAGVPENDLGGAMANYVMGSYYAFTLRDVPPQSLAPMARQFRIALAGTPEVAQASPQRRRKLYEELSFFGVALGAGARYVLENHSDPAKRAKLQTAARGHLEKVFGVPAERIQITADGIKLRN